MYFFKPIGLVALAVAAQAAISAEQMTENIDAITGLSAETNNIAQSVQITNLFSTGPQLINNFRQIITIASDDVTSMSKRSAEGISELKDRVRRSSKSDYSDSEQLAICASFREFVTVHQQLLSTVIGKRGLFSFSPFTRPIGKVLRILEGGVDALAFGIIDTVPTCARDATQNKNSLDTTLVEARDAYE